MQLTSKTTALFFNPFAAVPSLHVGFAFAIGIGVAAVTQRRLVRLLALAWGPVILLTVVVTGNHFVLDTVAGLLVTGLAFLMANRPPWARAHVLVVARRADRPAPACC